jgi:hypothetical protein
MEGEIDRSNCEDFEEDLRESKPRHRHKRDDRIRRKSRRSHVEDTYFDLYVPRHHDSTISALTMEDLTTFQELYDKCREAEAASNYRTSTTTPPSQGNTTTPMTNATPSTDTGNARMNARKSFYDLFLSRERESTISEITFEDWKSLNELYRNLDNSKLNDRSIDSFDSYQFG